MNLISCDECGVVLDANKLDFPKVDDYDDLPQECFVWLHRDKPTPCVKCPVCGANIPKEEEE